MLPCLLRYIHASIESTCDSPLMLLWAKSINASRPHRLRWDSCRQNWSDKASAAGQQAHPANPSPEAAPGRKQKQGSRWRPPQIVTARGSRQRQLPAGVNALPGWLLETAAVRGVFVGLFVAVHGLCLHQLRRVFAATAADVIVNARGTIAAGVAARA